MFMIILSFLGCAPAYTCTESPMGSCLSVETCCSSVDCYYDADGEIFDCDGTDCSFAASDVADYCADTTYYSY